LARFEEASWITFALERLPEEQRSQVLTRNYGKIDLQIRRERNRLQHHLSSLREDPALASLLTAEEREIEEEEMRSDVKSINGRLERFLSSPDAHLRDIDVDNRFAVNLNRRLEELATHRALADVCVASVARPKSWALIALCLLASLLFAVHHSIGGYVLAAVALVIGLDVCSLWYRYRRGTYGDDFVEVGEIGHFVVQETERHKRQMNAGAGSAPEVEKEEYQFPPGTVPA
jgi:hypothetical protein